MPDGSHKITNMKILATVVCFIVLQTASASALIVGDDAPMFFLRDMEGNNFYLSNYVGPKKKENTKGVILAFFASWCKPCKNELPILNALVDELAGKGIKVVIIGMNEDFDTILKTLNDIKVDKPLILSDRYGKIAEKFGVRSLPKAFFISCNGKICDVIPGEMEHFEIAVREKVGRHFK